jgi:hypothetical protein
MRKGTPTKSKKNSREEAKQVILKEFFSAEKQKRQS